METVGDWSGQDSCGQDGPGRHEEEGLEDLRRWRRLQRLEELATDHLLGPVPALAAPTVAEFG